MLKITEDFLNRLSRVVQRKASYGEIYQITSADGAPVQVVQKKPPPWIVSVKKKRRRRLSNSWPIWFTCIKQVYTFVALACFQLLYLQYIFSQVLLENGLVYSVLKLFYFIITFISLLQGGQLQIHLPITCIWYSKGILYISFLFCLIIFMTTFILKKDAFYAYYINRDNSI